MQKFDTVADVTIWTFVTCGRKRNDFQKVQRYRDGVQNFKRAAHMAGSVRFALVRIKLSCGNTGDSASELRAIDKRFGRTQGGVINKATIASSHGNMCS